MVTAKKAATPKPATVVAPAAVTPVAKKTTASKAASPAAPAKAKAIVAAPTKPEAQTTAKASTPKPKAVTASKTKSALNADQRNHYVEVAAFYIAERRGFAPGNPADDWCAAELEVDRLIATGHFN